MQPNLWLDSVKMRHGNVTEIRYCQDAGTQRAKLSAIPGKLFLFRNEQSFVDEKQAITHIHVYRLRSTGHFWVNLVLVVTIFLFIHCTLISRRSAGLKTRNTMVMFNCTTESRSLNGTTSVIQRPPTRLRVPNDDEINVR